MSLKTNNTKFGIIYPAVYLLRHLNYTQRFMLLWLVSFISIAVVISSLFFSLNQVTHVSNRELSGLLIIKTIHVSIAGIQENRITADKLKSALILRSLEAGLPQTILSSSDYLQVRQAWEHLDRLPLLPTDGERVRAYTNLLEQMHALLVRVADDYSLTTDADITVDTMLRLVLFTLPHAVEHLQQLRAAGHEVLLSKEMTERHEDRFDILISELNSTLVELQTDIKKIQRYNPSINSLDSTFGRIDKASKQVVNLIATDIVPKLFVTSASDFLAISDLAIDDSYRQILDTLIPTINTQIEERIARTEETMIVTITGSLFLFLIMVYLSMGIYSILIESLRSMAHSFHAFAKGALDERVIIQTHDEFVQLGDSFNKMANDFGILWEAKRKNEEALRIAAVAFDTQTAIIITDLTPKILRVNKAFEDITGYSAEEVVGHNPNTLSDPSIRKPPSFYAEMWAELSVHGKWSGEVVDRHKSGAFYPKWMTITAVNNQEGKLTHYVGTFFDITERKKIEQALKESRDELHLLLHSLAEGVYGLDRNGICTFVNQSCLRMMGFTEQEVLGSNMHNLIHHSSIDGSVYSIDQCKIYQQVFHQSSSIHVDNEVFWRKDGTPIPVEYWSHPIMSSSGVTGSIVTFIDITKRREAEKDIHRLAFYDPLTKLPNRRLFMDRLQQEIKKSHRSKIGMALLLLDLDGFKEVNDTMGHAAGDEVLCQAADRISACVREADTVARLGGDEFTVILSGLDVAERPYQIAEAIRLALLEPFHLSDGVSSVSASIGIASYPFDAMTAADLIKCADQAMYMAKAGGRNQFKCFH